MKYISLAARIWSNGQVSIPMFGYKMSYPCGFHASIPMAQWFTKTFTQCGSKPRLPPMRSMTKSSNCVWQQQRVCSAQNAIPCKDWLIQICIMGHKLYIIHHLYNPEMPSSKTIKRYAKERDPRINLDVFILKPQDVFRISPSKKRMQLPGSR